MGCKVQDNHYFNGWLALLLYSCRLEQVTHKTSITFHELGEV